MKKFLVAAVLAASVLGGQAKAAEVNVDKNLPNADTALRILITKGSKVTGNCAFQKVSGDGLYDIYIVKPGKTIIPDSGKISFCMGTKWLTTGTPPTILAGGQYNFGMDISTMPVKYMVQLINPNNQYQEVSCWYN